MKTFFASFDRVCMHTCPMSVKAVSMNVCAEHNCVFRGDIDRGSPVCVCVCVPMMHKSSQE